MQTSYIDWVVIAAYLSAMVAFGLWLARKTASSEDYFLGGRSVPPLVAALSIMATQTSTISLVGAPAFVAVKPGGGLRWLQYEVALPLAMLVLMVTFVPTLWRSGVMTVYELLEERFGLPTRLVLSAVFLLSRSLAAGVMIYATAVVIHAATGAPHWVLIGIIGLVCLLYSTLGGLVADVYTDAVQLVVLWGCVLVSIGTALVELGDLSLLTMPADRAQAIDLSAHGFGDGGDYGFWPLAIGGMFLYLAYYGTDQTQVQRVLAAPSVDAARRSLFLNGLLRFPLVLSYVVFGVVLAALVANDPSLVEAIGVGPNGQKEWDQLVPVFIVRHLPTGVVGVMIAGMLAASMSSLDSTFNSLSASTMRDYVERFGLLRAPSSRAYMRTARATTFAWGALCCGSALVVGGISDTVIEAVNKIGSVFYGPVLAVFVLALRTRFVGGSQALLGLFVGVGTNVALWQWAPSVSWLWWNAIGFAVALVVAAVASLPQASLRELVRETPDPTDAARDDTPASRRRYALLLGAAVGIVVISWLVGEAIAIR